MDIIGIGAGQEGKLGLTSSSHGPTVQVGTGTQWCWPGVAPLLIAPAGILGRNRTWRDGDTDAAPRCGAGGGQKGDRGKVPCQFGSRVGGQHPVPLPRCHQDLVAVGTGHQPHNRLWGGGLTPHPTVPTRVQYPQGRGWSEDICPKIAGHQDGTRESALLGVPRPLDGASSPRLWCHRTVGTTTPAVASPTLTLQKLLSGVGCEKEGGRGAGPLSWKDPMGADVGAQIQHQAGAISGWVPKGGRGEAAVLGKLRQHCRGTSPQLSFDVSIPPCWAQPPNFR